MKTKEKWTLIASSPSLEGIVKYAGEYWYSNHIKVTEAVPKKQWDVYNKNGLITLARVIRKANRYRLEIGS